MKNPILYFCTNHATHPVQCFLFIHMIPLSFSLSPLTSLGVPRFSFISFSSFPFPLPPSLHLPPYFLRSPPLIHKYIKSMSFFYSLEYLKRPIFCYHKVTQGSPLCDFMVTGKIEPSSYIPTSMWLCTSTHARIARILTKQVLTKSWPLFLSLWCLSSRGFIHHLRFGASVMIYVYFILLSILFYSLLQREEHSLG